MKKLLLLGALTLSLNASSQTIDWYYTPDGVNGSGWSYADAYIPANMILDSVYGGFQRPGVPTVASEDMAAAWVYGSTYAGGTGYLEPWNYADTNTSLYNRWIDLTSFNLVGEGVLRVAIPNGVNPAIFDSLGIAYHSVLSIEELSKGEKEIIKVVDLMGREVPFEKNKVLIYVYSDGTTERVFEFE